VQINFTEKESQLQKIFLKSAIGFFYFKMNETFIIKEKFDIIK